VPADPRAYEYFLRANQFNNDPKQWAAARDLYLRCVEADPCYAPAWARLGRIHHVMSKYLPAGVHEGLKKSENAFKQALDLNPDLPVVHKAYAQLEVDLGRAGDAMVRLLERARESADSEVFAGLVSPLRYCGLLEASVAAHARARALEPKVRTSVPHTWFLQRDNDRVSGAKLEEFPYIMPIALMELGRGEQILPSLRALEEKNTTRLRDFVMAARTLLEDDPEASVAAIGRVTASGFGDPEGLFYLARHLSRLRQTEAALQLLERVISGGYSCYPAFASDPWLDPVRDTSRFIRLLSRAEQKHKVAQRDFARLEGDRILGMAARRAVVA
jgi:tetratricopeptide (TPR) repeat protein